MKEKNTGDEVPDEGTSTQIGELLVSIFEQGPNAPQTADFKLRRKKIGEINRNEHTPEPPQNK